MTDTSSVKIYKCKTCKNNFKMWEDDPIPIPFVCQYCEPNSWQDTIRPHKLYETINPGYYQQGLNGYYKNGEWQWKGIKHGDYHRYLDSPFWRALRHRYFQVMGKTCQECGCIPGWKELHLHHTTYTNLGMEDYSDLKGLCAECHELEHEARDYLSKERIQR